MRRRGSCDFPRGTVAGLFDAREVLRAGAEDADVLAFGDAPQHARVRMHRRAIVEHDGRAGRERTDEPVPHHPAAGRVVEDDVPGADVGMKDMLLQVLQQHAAGAMHDALGWAGRTRREDDGQRVIEGHGGECRRCGGIAELHEALGRRNPADVGLLLQEADDHGGHQRRQLARNFGDHDTRVDGLSVPVVAVDGKQDLRGDLAKAVQHARNAEVRRTGRPDRTDAARSERRDDGFGRICDKACHAVAGSDTRLAQSRSNSRDLGMQFRPRDLPAATALVMAYQCDTGTRMAKQLFGVVEAAAREPACLGHVARMLQDRVGLAVQAQSTEACSERPELRREVDGPAVQRTVVRKIESRLHAGFLQEAPHRTRLDAGAVGLPDR